MEQLFLETPWGWEIISSSLVAKYHIKKGTLSPFNRFRVVNEQGDDHLEPTPSYIPKGQESQDEHDVMLTTSEARDFTEAADS